MNFPTDPGPDGRAKPLTRRDPKEKLVKILSEVGQRRIWRSVYDEQGRLLARGHADERDGPPEVLDRIDFQGRRVLDVGCNFGYYSFLAWRRGAAWVLGLDTDPQVIEGCGLLKIIYGAENTRFLCRDFLENGSGGPFDLCLLINFIGKKRALRGVAKCLDHAAGLSREAMIITAAHAYHIPTFMAGNYSGLRSRYPETYISGEYFLLTDYLRDYLLPSWDMTLLSPQYPELNVKRTLLFTRRPPSEFLPPS